jgi:hypothetical protein
MLYDSDEVKGHLKTLFRDLSSDGPMDDAALPSNSATYMPI